MPAPVVQAKLSLTNYVASATILASAGGEQAGWPRANIKYPQQPFVPWKTATNTYNACILDFGVPRPLDLVIAVDLNYTDVRIHLDSDPAFATPVYSSGVIPVARNPWNTRYTAVHLFSPSQTQRYFYYEIPDQATTDGLAYFRTGGLWVGSSTALPRDIRWEERILRKEPHLDVALLGGGTQRVSTGRPCVEIRANRIAATLRATPGTGDELGSWLEIDRLMTQAGHFAYYFNRGNTAEGFIVRKMNESEWSVHPSVSEDGLVLHEVVGP